MRMMTKRLGVFAVISGAVLLGTALLVSLAWVPTANAQVSTERIVDGGFESGVLVPQAPPYPDCVGSWCALIGPLGGGIVQLVSSPVNTGQMAVRIDTVTARGGAFIYQGVGDISSCFTTKAHVYRNAGINLIEVFGSWDKTTGGGVNISNVYFTENGVTLTAWGTAKSFDRSLGPNVWHEVAIRADGKRGIQELAIDGEVVGRVTAATAKLQTTDVSLIIGDTAGNAQHGSYYYDDVSLEESACPEAPKCGGDIDGDNEVTVNEIIVGVNNALAGCVPPLRLASHYTGRGQELLSGECSSTGLRTVEEAVVEVQSQDGSTFVARYSGRPEGALQIRGTIDAAGQLTTGSLTPEGTGEETLAGSVTGHATPNDLLVLSYSARSGSCTIAGSVVAAKATQ